MRNYLKIVSDVLEFGKWKKPVRHQADGTAVELANDTIALPNQLFSHDMKNGFPLLTTKKMPLKTILVELEGFIKGITDKQWFKDRGCNIWNEWASPYALDDAWDELLPIEQAATTKKEYQTQVNDLGPIYGYQWRSFGNFYINPNPTEDDFDNAYEDMRNPEQTNGINGGSDQLKNIVNTLHKNPYDRRMVCSAWNPNQIDQMALPPCHWGWNVTVIDDEINLFWVQRSCDLMLGVPFNIASYAALLMLLAKESGFKPGNLSGMLVDCHIYRNHLDGAHEQLKREPRTLPTLNIKDRNGKFSIFDWEASDVELIGYDSHPKLKFGEVTV